MDERKQNQKNSFIASAKGILFLVLVMIGIFCMTSLVKMTGLVKPETEEKEKQEENALSIEKANADLVLKKDVETEEGIASLPLGMYLRVIDYEKGILTLEIDNQSGYHMGYREVFTVVKEEDEEWQVLGTIIGSELVDPEETDLDAIKEITLMDLEKTKASCDLNALGKLEPGNYQIMMEDIAAEFTLEKEEVS